MWQVRLAGAFGVRPGLDFNTPFANPNRICGNCIFFETAFPLAFYAMEFPLMPRAHHVVAVGVPFPRGPPA